MQNSDQLLSKAFECLRQYHEQTGENPIDNYSFREIGAIAQVKKNFNPSIERLTGRHGADATSKQFQQIEFKSCKVTPKKTIHHLRLKDCVNFQFDKQNDPVRREAVMKYDAFGFHIHRHLDPEPVLLVYVDAPRSVESIKKNLIAKKQEEAMVVFEMYETIGRRIPRDSISISLKEIFEVSHDLDLHILVKGVKLTLSELMDMFEKGEIAL